MFSQKIVLDRRNDEEKKSSKRKPVWTVPLLKWVNAGRKKRKDKEIEVEIFLWTWRRFIGFTEMNPTTNKQTNE